MDWDEEQHPRDDQGRFATTAANTPRTAERPAVPMRLWAAQQTPQDEPHDDAQARRFPKLPAISPERLEHVRNLAVEADYRPTQEQAHEQANNLSPTELAHFERERQLTRSALVENFARRVEDLGGISFDNPNRAAVQGYFNELGKHYASPILSAVYSELMTRRLKQATAAQKAATMKLKEWGKAPIATQSPALATPNATPTKHEAAAIAKQLQNLKTARLGNLTESHMTPDEQKTVRDSFIQSTNRLGFQVNNLVNNHLLKRLLPEEELEGVLGKHSWEGRISLSQSTTNHLADAHTNLSVGAFLNGTQMGAVKTMLHEQIHGAGPLVREAYSKHGIVVEEATTEVAARWALPHYLPASAYKDDWYRLKTPYDAPKLTAVNSSYQHYIDALGTCVDRAFDAAIGRPPYEKREETKLRNNKLVTDAALEYRNAPKGSVQTADDAVAGYHAAMERAARRHIEDEAVRERFLTEHEKQIHSEARRLAPKPKPVTKRGRGKRR